MIFSIRHEPLLAPQPLRVLVPARECAQTVVKANKQAMVAVISHWHSLSARKVENALKSFSLPSIKKKLAAAKFSHPPRARIRARRHGSTIASVKTNLLRSSCVWAT